MADLFAKSLLSTEGDEEKEKTDVYVVDTSNDLPAGELPVIESNDGLPVATMADPGEGPSAKQLGQVGLSIASSIGGFMLGAVTTIPATVGQIVIPRPEVFMPKGPMYDNAEDNTLYDPEPFPDALASNMHAVMEAFTYTPSDDQAKRFVQNIGEFQQEIRQTVGDFVVDSLDELQAVTGLQENQFVTALKNLSGAGAQASLDLALIAVGGRMAARPELKVLGERTPVEGLSSAKLPIDALDSLPNSKPKFSSFEEAQARIEKLASGEERAQIVVEQVEGLPTKVISGQDQILALKELRKRGIPVKEAKVVMVDNSIVRKIDVEATRRANKAFDTDRTAAAELQKHIRAGMLGQVARLGVDASSNVKGQLLKTSGELGQKAVMDLELAAGATPRAKLLTDEALARVSKGLSSKSGSGATIGERVIPTEYELFQEFIRAQRIIAIEKSKLGKTKVKFESGTTGYDMANWLQTVKDTIGTERFSEYSIRAHELFETTAKQLEKLQKAGIISMAEFNQMKNINYLRTDVIDQLDPVTKTKLGGVTIDIGESGIQPIKGHAGGVSLDFESILADYMIRTENRIARNNANKRLYDLAVADPNNSIVKLGKTHKDGTAADAPRGFDTLRVMIDGKPQTLVMPEWLAQEWKVGDPAISAAIANIARIVSGSAVVRPLATGYNPAFVLTNLPRDIVHAWLATNDVFSQHLPVYLGQIARDMAIVANDSLTKTGRYKAYIEEGGGMSFLTHQGREALVPAAGSRYAGWVDKQIRGAKPGLKFVRDALSYLNEQSEIIVRLAIREQVLRNQKERGLPIDPAEATWQARRYLDFAQGGTAVKAFDNIVPYLNATTQAYRTVVNSAKKNPSEFAVKFTWLAGTYASWEAYNMLFHKEAHEAIPEQRRREFFVIHTDRFIIDENGNKRFVYFKVKKDQSTVPVTAWLEQLVDYYITGKAPTDSNFAHMTKALPGIATAIPSMSAYNTYVSDYNFWHDEDIFGRDKNIEDYAKFKSLPYEPTSEIFKNFGELFNMSPEGLAAAYKQVVPTNFYMQMGAYAYDYSLAQENPVQAALTTEEMLAKIPGVNRVYSLTHPAEVALENLDRIEREVNTPVELNRKKLDEFLYGARQTGDYSQAKEFARTFSQEDPFQFSEMMNRVEASVRLDKIMSKRKTDFGDLPRSWWLGMLNVDSKARAEIYFEAWHQAPGDRKRWMDSTAAALSSGDLAFIDKEFAYNLSRLKQTRNSEVIGLDQE